MVNNGCNLCCVFSSGYTPLITKHVRYLKIEVYTHLFKKKTQNSLVRRSTSIFGNLKFWVNSATTCQWYPTQICRVSELSLNTRLARCTKGAPYRNKDQGKFFLSLDIELSFKTAEGAS